MSSFHPRMMRLVWVIFIQSKDKACGGGYFIQSKVEVSDRGCHHPIIRCGLVVVGGGGGGVIILS